MPEKISIKYDNGEQNEADLLCYLNIDDVGKVVLFHFNEMGENNLLKVYAAKVSENENGMRFSKIDNDDEWSVVKNKMRELIAGGAV